MGNPNSIKKRKKKWRYIIGICLSLFIIYYFSNMQGDVLIQLDQSTTRIVLSTLQSLGLSEDLSLEETFDGRFIIYMDTAEKIEKTSLYLERAIHVILFFFAASICSYSLGKLTRKPVLMCLFVLVGLLIIAYINEMNQQKIYWRGFETMDVLLEWIGAAAGICFALLLYLFTSKRKKHAAAPAQAPYVQVKYLSSGKDFFGSDS